ncbi:MAG TPA: transglycosylase family protein [Pseudonocardia sp.]
MDRRHRALGLVAALLAGVVAVCGLTARTAKTITLTVDGRDRAVPTTAGTVGAALRAAGLDPRPRDRVEPDAGTGVANGDQVILRRARALTLVEDGRRRRVWTTEATVGAALAGLGTDPAAAWTDVPADARIPPGGLTVALSVTREVTREVTLVDGAAAARAVSTRAGTVRALLAERGTPLGDDDLTLPAPDDPVRDGDRVQVVRGGGGEVREDRAVPPPEVERPDPTLPPGRRVLLDAGEPGRLSSVYRVVVRNGREVARERLYRGPARAPRPRIVRVGTGAGVAEPVPSITRAAVWDRLARCEAGGDWQADTGNGYYGGLQFDGHTWRANGGTTYAALPHQASREEQIAVAQKVRDTRGGFGAWPACSRKLGLAGDGSAP